METNISRQFSWNVAAALLKRLLGHLLSKGRRNHGQNQDDPPDLVLKCHLKRSRAIAEFTGTELAGRARMYLDAQGTTVSEDICWRTLQ
jgi:hypothetical protein